MHVITDRLKRDPRIKDGTNSNGPWRLYSFEVSDSWKDRSGNKNFTNYQIGIFAKTPAMMAFLDSNLIAGAVVEVAADNLELSIWESDSGPKPQVKFVNPVIKRIISAVAPGGGGSNAPARDPQPNSNNSGWGQNNPSPQQSKQQDDDDDIPF